MAGGCVTSKSAVKLEPVRKYADHAGRGPPAASRDGLFFVVGNYLLYATISGRLGKQRQDAASDVDSNDLR
jgi:hypothetical protein